MQRFTADIPKPRQIRHEERQLQTAVKSAQMAGTSRLHTATLAATVQQTVSLGTYPKLVHPKKG